MTAPLRPEMVRLTDNPVRNISLLLQALRLELAHMQQALSLMEVPVSRWAIMSRAKEVTTELAGSISIAIVQHERTAEELKTLGY